MSEPVPSDFDDDMPDDETSDAMAMLYPVPQQFEPRPLAAEPLAEQRAEPVPASEPEVVDVTEPAAATDPEVVDVTEPAAAKPTGWGPHVVVVRADPLPDPDLALRAAAESAPQRPRFEADAARGIPLAQARDHVHAVAARSGDAGSAKAARPKSSVAAVAVLGEDGPNGTKHGTEQETALTADEARGYGTDVAVIDLTQTRPMPPVAHGSLTVPSTGAEPGRTLVGMDARNVSAWFGSHKVLEGVSLTMAPGEVTALIGPSGCGKSTFLRILNRMHEMIRGAQLAGEVLLDGRDVYESGRRPAEVRRRIGMVFQRPNPFPAMSIYDNVVSGLKLAGIQCKDKDSLVERSLQRAGLWVEVRNRLQSPGGALSGGQQQRLCIARSLAVAPDVLLMDEPCSALDPTSTRRVEETIAELRGEVTIVIVTHNMQQAARVSQACAFFLATHDTPGHIVEAAPTQDMFNNPKDNRTADYVHGRFG